jgi:hypothetical protein
MTGIFENVSGNIVKGSEDTGKVLNFIKVVSVKELCRIN